MNVRQRIAGCMIGVAGVLAATVSVTAAAPPPASPPPIRIGAGNAVPACVTPERLMAFLATRNGQLDPRFRGIAQQYKAHGEVWRVRWDYAFYQMAIETNFLTYRRPDGRMGDVDPRQNNFAGIGTTGGGVPGDRYRDVSTGVLAQIQHLVVYSGERLAQPVAPRTQLKQDVILQLSEPIAARRPITFADLAGRWAVDKAYGRSIEWVAASYRDAYCRGHQPEPPARAAVVLGHTTTLPAAAPVAAPRILAPPTEVRRRPTTEPAALGAPVAAATCSIEMASYGGSSAALVQARRGSHVTWTVLDVASGAEQDDARAFIRSYAPTGQIAGTFANRAAAIAGAIDACPTGLGRTELKREPAAPARSVASKP